MGCCLLFVKYRVKYEVIMLLLLRKVLSANYKVVKLLIILEFRNICLLTPRSELKEFEFATVLTGRYQSSGSEVPSCVFGPFEKVTPGTATG